MTESFKNTKRLYLTVESLTRKFFVTFDLCFLDLYSHITESLAHDFFGYVPLDICFVFSL